MSVIKYLKRNRDLTEYFVSLSANMRKFMRALYVEYE
jgi:hypothetical protein